MENKLNLKVLTWNANGKTHHKLELQAILTEHNIDIAMISESHLTPTKNIKILGYKACQSNHLDNSVHVGSVILVRNSLIYSPLPQISETYLQASSILVSLNKYTNLIFSSTYFPPGPEITTDNFNNFFKPLWKYFIVAGDLNAKHSSWGCFATNTRGRTLLRAMENSNIKILLPPLPTYWHSHQNRRPDILDIFIAKAPSNYNLNVSKINDLSSDHSPIILEFKLLPLNNLEKNLQYPGKIDWYIFQTIIETRTQLNPSLKSNEDIDATIFKLTTDIHECLQSATTSAQHTLPITLSRTISNTSFVKNVKQDLAGKVTSTRPINLFIIN